MVVAVVVGLAVGALVAQFAGELALLAFVAAVALASSGRWIGAGICAGTGAGLLFIADR